MTSIDDLVGRNAGFAADGYSGDLTINAWGNITVIGCVDSRVDPSYILGLGNGEASVIRNVGGRVTPATLQTLAMLAKVRRANAATSVPGTRNLVLLHHTDCGMSALADFPDVLAEYFQIPSGQLDTKSVRDPYGAVRVDVEVLRAHQHAPDTLLSGLVYDVGTGGVEVVVAPTLLDPP
jgi:carbonic anhydrase